ncbi:hypothetical protein ANN_17019 [Periplaneta americana]|uniref:Uncharacterized protein n=1 Tax=Periplaneta americana TaxID=6978 RepID=A0ABQ8SRQ7_PERAM|nr:hypothetical protein ANN_17019 [Periplaneta americana]
MSPGSSTESYPAFAQLGLRENPGKNLNQSHDTSFPEEDDRASHRKLGSNYPTHLAENPRKVILSEQRATGVAQSVKALAFRSEVAFGRGPVQFEMLANKETNAKRTGNVPDEPPSMPEQIAGYDSSMSLWPPRSPDLTRDFFLYNAPNGIKGEGEDKDEEWINGGCDGRKKEITPKNLTQTQSPSTTNFTQKRSSCMRCRRSSRLNHTCTNSAQQARALLRSGRAVFSAHRNGEKDTGMKNVNQKRGAGRTQSASDDAHVNAAVLERVDEEKIMLKLIRRGKGIGWVTTG